ncbi:MAG: UDP-N-acetylmuramoyl-L-alanine--D-glutamate ligase [Planctomycetes bacterium]|nr:UDP-N-acetylmuramoyl-L-alanine--D-glutamate ligase [Planctomycetota bacterium]
MKPLALPDPGTHALIHGLGRFGGGREAVRYLARRGCRVRVCDRSAADDLVAVQRALREHDVDWQLGREDEALLDGIELFVANPAVPAEHPLLAAANRRGIAVTQELDLFLAAYPGRVVGVTVTNGKSTTATLLHRALRRAGVDVLLGGNIGHSLLAEEAHWRSPQIAVVEMSSFQLERLAATATVHGAVFARVLEDHLDRHGTLASYRAAKGRLAAAARDFVIHCAEDEVAAAYPTPAARRLRYALCEPAPASAGLSSGFIATRVGATAAEVIVHRDALHLIGDFQVENVLAASLAARCLGAAAGDIGFAMATAPPLPFRLQHIATIDGVRFYDNGVSTEAASTVSALRALRRGHGRVHWVGGGKSKTGDHARLATEVSPWLDSAHLFGASGAPLAACLTAIGATTHERLPEALASALAAAHPGDSVLFSPAHASFDQYPNFRARALEFHEWIRSRRAKSAVAG